MHILDFISIVGSSIVMSRARKNTPLYGCEGMLGNQDKMAENSKVCMEIQSQLILPN